MIKRTKVQEHKRKQTTITIQKSNENSCCESRLEVRDDHEVQVYPGGNNALTGLMRTSKDT